MHSNIITHHAEDGSGVGSAIIAGKCFAYTWSRPFADSVCFYVAMTKFRKEAGKYAHV